MAGITEQEATLARIGIELISAAIQNYVILQRMAGKSDDEIRLMLDSAIAGTLARPAAALPDV